MAIQFSDRDRGQLAAQGKTEHDVADQLQHFRNGIPFIQLDRPCKLRDGIRQLNDEELREYRLIFEAARDKLRIVKFVPASGTCDRMFKVLRSFANHPDRSISDIREAALEGGKAEKFLLRFLDNLEDFAFYPQLKAAVDDKGQSLEEWRDSGRYAAILDMLLSADGLNYAGLAKGLLAFHRDGDEIRSAFSEHLREAAEYACDGNGVARVHFTVPRNHQEKIEAHIRETISKSTNSGISFEVSYSIQEPSTETIVVHPDNTPYRNEDGSLLFRPGGHGALLKNLNALEADLVFIKNIDNVVQECLKGDTYLYKQALGGLMISLQDQIHDYLEQLGSASKNHELLGEIERFAINKLSIELPQSYIRLDADGRYAYWSRQLNRPLRVCGMVRNEGEPGGGPFWVRQRDGSSSLQIVESSQVDRSNEQQLTIWRGSTHFNPVNLVCGVRDANSNLFNLTGFRDPRTGFISEKSNNGQELKALELPGLWNGAMAHWITVFVEVPSTTFSPVKTVLDLLRPEHMPVDEEALAQ